MTGTPDGKGITLRPATAEDVAAIVEIYAWHVLNGTGSFDTVPRTVEATLERVNECHRRGWPFLVAVRVEQVIGYTYATQFRDRPAYVSACENSIYVAAHERAKGVGKLLLAALLKDAEAAGFRQMIAVVGGGEPASVALHESLGFRHAGRMQSVGRKFGRWLDTVYLQIALGAGDTTAPEREPA